MSTESDDLVKLARELWTIAGSYRREEAIQKIASRIAAQKAAEPNMPAICEALGFDPTNHHNAAKCPYCTPQKAAEVDAPSELQLAIIRRWPEGFQDRLQAVWLDVISFIPNVKLYDLQRVLAEFGFAMKVYEAAAAPPAEPEGKV